jgi:DNA adenine methylase
MCKPFLKWVGGKTQIMDQVIATFPAVMNDYHEPFIGGGSVLLTLLSHVKEKEIFVKGKIYAYDLNEALIYVYKNIQSDYTLVYFHIKKLIDTYNSLKEPEKSDERKKIVIKTLEDAYKDKETFYYWLRDEYNKIDKKTIEASALFIFLNKTCFRGVFRMGPKGFNVPYGNYKNPEVVTQNHLKEVSELIQPVIFTHCDFKEALSNVKENSFVYLDPPYVPENVKSFVGYTDKGFSEHKKLFELCDELNNKGIRFVMSNSNVEVVTSHFKDYKVYPIECKRSINSKKPGSTTTEVIIVN